MSSLLIQCKRCDYYFKTMRAERHSDYKIFDLDFDNCLVITALCDKCNEFVIVEEKDFRSGALTMQCSEPKCFGKSTLENQTWEENPDLKVSFTFCCTECGKEMIYYYPLQ